MPTLFIANRNYSSWSLRPWVVLRELGIPFAETLVPFGGNAEFPDFSVFSPTARVPCLVDGDIVVWDSLAIVEYLAEAHPRVWPSDRAARAWARSATAEMHAGFAHLRATCAMNCGLRVRIDNLPAPVRADVQRLDTLWTQGLSRFGGRFLAGAAFTAVDGFFAPVAFRVQTYGLALSATAGAYVDRMLALPAMRAWYEAALLEPWRDAAHEAEARALGRIVEDLRHGPVH